MDMKTCKSWLIHQRFSDDLPRNSEIVSMFNWLIAAVESLTAEKEAAEKFLRMANEDTEFYKKLNRENCSELESSLAQAREELAMSREGFRMMDAMRAEAVEGKEAAEQREKGLREDAERWRAIIGCARVRTLGSAGIVIPNEQGYAHIGVELWTHHTASSEREAIEWLTKFADISKAALAAASKEE